MGMAKPKRPTVLLLKSPVLKRSVKINGHQTSVSLENEFWDALREIAEAQNIRVSELIANVDNGRQHSNLSSLVRVFVVSYYSEQRGAKGRR
jgi:predicted DNA-binding ribbon-helix-helix protein